MRIRRIGFQTKNGFPAAPARRPRALLNNRYCRNPLRARCRANGSNCHACFKESRRAEPALDATLRAALASSHIPIIRRNLTRIVESRVKPLKNIYTASTDGIVRRIMARVESNHEEYQRFQVGNLPDSDENPELGCKHSDRERSLFPFPSSSKSAR